MSKDDYDPNGEMEVPTNIDITYNGKTVREDHGTETDKENPTAR